MTDLSRILRHTGIEIAYGDLACFLQLVQEYRRNQVAATNEDDVGADPSAGKGRSHCMTSENKDDRDGAQTIGMKQ
jgi:hypothetical protein